MKIILIHYSTLPVVGGVESVLGAHARLMSDAGHAVRLVAARGESPTGEIEFIRLPLIDSLNPEILSAKKELDAGRIPSAFDTLVRRLGDQLRPVLQNTDVLMAHNVCSLNKNLVLTEALHRLSQETGFPHLVLWHHDLAWTTPRYQSELHDGYPWNLLRSDWPDTTHVVASALRRGELSRLTSISTSRIHIIPNGINSNKFLNLEETTIRLAERLGLPKTSPLLFLPVRITPRKNLPLALRTLACLREEFPSAGILVTGPLGAHNPHNKDYFQEVLALRRLLGLESSAHFLAETEDSPILDSAVADLYRLSDALFLPSHEEGFGIPILEAGISRRPIFCADIPALRELAGESAVYFSPDEEPRQVASRIAQFFRRDPVFRLAATVRKDFDWYHIYSHKIEPLLNGIRLHLVPASEGS